MENEKWLEKKLNLDNTYKALIRYLYMRRDLMELELKDYMAKTMLAFLIMVMLFGLLLLILLFTSLAGALFLNDLLNSKFTGFLLMAVLFALLGFLVYMMRKKLITGVVYKMVFEPELDEQSDDDEK